MARRCDSVARIDGDFSLLCCDLSMRRPGFAVLEYCAASKSVTVDIFKHVNNKGRKSHGEMLENIADAFASFIQRDQAAVCVRERGFSRFANETQCLFKVIGVADLLLWQHWRARFQELAPASVKKLLAGSGRASKQDVADALTRNVGKQRYACDDESDAVAVGVAWL